jgi:protein-disulfide isomerase
MISPSFVRTPNKKLSIIPLSGRKSVASFRRIVPGHRTDHPPVPFAAPEVVREPVRLSEERERAAQQERTKAVVLARRKDIQQDPSSPVVGKEGGVTVVEFFDYHCGYCKRTESAVRKLLTDHPDMPATIR